jgi:hypothetical protein
MLGCRPPRRLGVLLELLVPTGMVALVARSSFGEISVYRTTMGTESFCGRLKNAYLGKKRRDVMHLLEVIDRKMITESVSLSRGKTEAN